MAITGFKNVRRILEEDQDIVLDEDPDLVVSAQSALLATPTAHNSRRCHLRRPWSGATARWS